MSLIIWNGLEAFATVWVFAVSHWVMAWHCVNQSHISVFLSGRRDPNSPSNLLQW